MKIVISPAKSLDLETALPSDKHTQSDFLEFSNSIHPYLKAKSPKELAELMHISDNLAQLNWTRNQAWLLPFNLENARPALYCFNGEVYTGIDAFTIPLEKLDALQSKLRILSGLYGMLKPLDLMQAYRLEMGIKLPVGTSKDLYAFWKPKLAAALNNELEDGELFINLASTEYFSSIDTKVLKVPVITPEFKDYKDGKLKVISFFAKKARGLMVRYILDNNIETLEGIKSFNCEGYGFDANLSTDTKLVFTR